MQNVLNKSKYIKEELALLAIFALGIAICYLMVLQRNRIHISKPIELAGSGISAPIPVGKIWDSTGQWTYKAGENSLDLSAVMKISGQLEARVVCRYFLAPDPKSALEYISEEAANAQANIVSDGQIAKDYAVMYWAQFAMGNATADSFIGVMDLPNNRRLEIIVVAVSDEATASQLFTKISDGIKFNPDRMLDKGERFVEDLKSKGLRELLDLDTDDPKEIFYLIKENDISIDNSESSGFMLNVFNGTSTENSWAVVSGEEFHLSLGDNSISRDSIFEFDSSFNRFIWQSRITRANSREDQVVKIQLSDDGSMMVNILSPLREKVFWPGKAAIPNTILDVVSRELVSHNDTDVMVDIILSNGWIMPAVLRQMDAGELAEWSGEPASYGVAINYVHGQGNGQRIYFDSDKQIIAKVDFGKNGSTWIRSDSKTLLDKSEFEPWHEHIIRILGQSPND